MTGFFSAVQRPLITATVTLFFANPLLPMEPVHTLDISRVSRKNTYLMFARTNKRNKDIPQKVNTKYKNRSLKTKGSGQHKRKRERADKQMKKPHNKTS